MELRQMIIDCAVSLFQVKGLHFTMQDVAEAMHIAKKTIYTCFESKQDLLCAMLDDGFDRIQAAKREILESDLELTEKLKKTMIAMPDQYLVIDFRMMRGLAEKYPAAQKKLVERLEADWEPVTALIEEGIRQRKIRNISIPILRTMFTASIEAFLADETLNKENISYSSALERMMDIIMNGIREDHHENQ